MLHPVYSYLFAKSKNNKPKLPTYYLITSLNQINYRADWSQSSTMKHQPGTRCPLVCASSDGLTVPRRH